MITIEYDKPSASGEYLEVELSDVLVSSDQTQASTGGKATPCEAIHLNFVKIEVKYETQQGCKTDCGTQPGWRGRRGEAPLAEGAR